MNERKYALDAALLVWNGDPDIPHGKAFDVAQAFAAEARKRGLFDEPDLTPTGAEQLAKAERERDEARKLVREMAEAINHIWEIEGLTTEGALLIQPLLDRAKGMTND